MTTAVKTLKRPTESDILDKVEKWLGTYIKTAQPGDLQILTLWIVHTHAVHATYTTPRLLLDSPAPGSGKTTVLDHASRLCFKAVQAASLSSPSLLARLLEKEPRTILIDEADRTLHPKADGVGELLAVLNSGYRFGASRPVLVPDKEEGGWKAVEMSTFGAVAMAGNSPDLPDDTKSRCIRVLLLPDTEGTVEDSDWQDIEEDARKLHDQIEIWADQVREFISLNRPTYPEGLKGRNRERWAPLLKVAIAAGADWEDKCIKLINQDLESQKDEKDSGIQRTARHLTLLKDIATVWPQDSQFIATQDLLQTLKFTSPSFWGESNQYGALTAQGMGRMLVNHFSIRSDRLPDGDRKRGYYKSSFIPAWKAFNMPFGQFSSNPSDEPDGLVKPANRTETPAGSDTSSNTSGSNDTPTNQPAEALKTSTDRTTQAVLNTLSPTHPRNLGAIMREVKQATGSATTVPEVLDKLEAEGRVTQPTAGNYLLKK